MDATTKTVLRGFDYQHCDDFAAYLNHMARQGWHFKEWKAGLVFEQGQPDEAVYAVEVFTDGTEFDTRPEPKTKEFAEYCEAAGWQLIDAKRKFCIFKKVRPDAVEIMTAEERLRCIAKEENRRVLYSLITAAVWSGMKAMDFFSVSFAANIFSNTSILVTEIWFIFLVTSLFRAVHFYIWKYRMTSRIQKGLTVWFGKGPKNGLGLYSIYNVISFSGCALYLLGCWYWGQTRMIPYFLGYLAILLFMSFLIARFRPDANTNAIIQTVLPLLLFIGVMTVSLLQVYEDNQQLRSRQQIPLYAEDIQLDYGELESSSGYIKTSVFGTYTAYSLHYEENRAMFYVAYQTEKPWILDRLWEIETKGAANAVRTDCADAWNANTGFRNQNNQYYLRYSDSILIFTLYDSFEPTNQQIAAILEKLGLG